jgi:hypothetical protein
MPYSHCSPCCRKDFGEDGGKDGERRCDPPVGHVTKEVFLMIVGRTLEITHRVEENVEAMRLLAEDSAKANKTVHNFCLSSYAASPPIVRRNSD